MTAGSGLSTTDAALPDAAPSAQEGSGARLASLIARLEQEKEGNRRLDAEIAAAIDARPRWARPDDEAIIANPSYYPVGECTLGKSGPSFTSLAYTTSLDAALTLVPEGWNLRLAESYIHVWWAELREGWETSFERVAIGKSPSYALALCIACLKARKSLTAAEDAP